MAMMNIEYRHRGKVKKTEETRRGTEGMIKYLSDLVAEMRSAKISAEFIESLAADGEANTVLINGKDVEEILEGLKIIIPEDDDICDDRAPKMVTFGRPTLQWNERFVEDIPDILMKNAISKVYSDLRA